MSGRETPEQIADRLLAPNNTSGWWTYDQVRALIIEAAETAPLSAAERRDARAALRMIRETVEKLFGPSASIDSEEGVLATRGPQYHHEAEAIIAGLQRIHGRLMRR